MKQLWCLSLCALALLLARDTRRARACGGASIVAPEVVEPAHLLNWDEESELPRKEERFLYPYLSAHPQEAKLLWQFAYEGLQEVPAPNAQRYLRASAEGHPALARQEAQKLVNQWYALPPVPAAAQREIALRAATFLEQPSAAPSASPTQEFLRIMEQFTTHVPNGWAAGVKNQVPASFWAEQLASTNAWLAANRAHPLADLVSLWQERVAYFSGDTQVAWAVLFQLYPRRRGRALAEMRYLVQQNALPSAAQLDAVTDPLLAASLVTHENATPARWERYWRLSESAARKVEGTVLQERLLQALSDGPSSALPASFPKQAAKPSQYWGKLRGLLLLRHGQFALAKEQLSLLAPEPEQATLLAAASLALGDPVQAARTPALNTVDVAYLIEVLTPPAELSKLRNDPSPELAAAAETALASDSIARGDFVGAARWYKPVDAAQGADLERMAALQKQGDELGLARALRARGNRLGVGMPNDYYRGFSTRYASLKPDSAEAQGLVRYFEASSGAFQALRRFVPWLEAHVKDKQALSVLSEADAAYVGLQSFGGWENLFWVRYLTNHDLAVRLRRIAKEVRKAALVPAAKP
ncbi:MAG: hypothetical protein ABJB12_20580 [Pseudomonadota bacterium]